jgi:hypothetical protein
MTTLVAALSAITKHSELSDIALLSLGGLLLSLLLIRFGVDVGAILSGQS